MIVRDRPTSTGQLVFSPVSDSSGSSCFSPLVLSFTVQYARESCSSLSSSARLSLNVNGAHGLASLPVCLFFRLLLLAAHLPFYTFPSWLRPLIITLVSLVLCGLAAILFGLARLYESAPVKRSGFSFLAIVCVGCMLAAGRCLAFCFSTPFLLFAPAMPRLSPDGKV